MAVTSDGLFARLFSGQGVVKPARQSTRIHAFIRKAHQENHGATSDLKRVYQAYLDASRKKPSAK